MTIFGVLDETGRNTGLCDRIPEVLGTVAPHVADTADLPLPAKVRYRLLTQMGILRELEPDVVCLQEAKHWDENGGETVNKVAAALKMEPRLALSASHGCHLVTRVRPPRVRFLRFYPDIAERNFHHTVSRADLQVEGVGAALRVLHTHLAPFDPDKRVAEARWLTQYGDRDDPLLVGDPNTEAPAIPRPIPGTGCLRRCIRAIGSSIRTAATKACTRPRCVRCRPPDSSTPPPTWSWNSPHRPATGTRATATTGPTTSCPPSTSPGVWSATP